MRKYEKLIKFIDDKKLTLYFVLSIARTRSTALQLSLVQAHEINGQINLPFNSGRFSRSIDPSYIYQDFRDKISNTSLEEVARRINTVIEPAVNENGHAKFIIHEHFDFLLKEYLPFMLKLSNNFVICVRDPRIQFLSYIFRSFNKFFLEQDSKENKQTFSADDILTLLIEYKISPDNFEKFFNKIVLKKK